uniref:Reverse transcriptase/retrotransposon-derived protein RNase H-like domain-containing protein n=1 Tax=Amphimedon queenslandica TaxID=400682 RepID=A0A1X7VRB3_AMPQE
LRICIDYREINKRTQKNSFPLQRPDEVQDRLGRSNIFTKLDSCKGFWQVPIHPDDRHKTAFSPRRGMGLYEFHCMPFGFTVAQVTFTSLMDHVLRGLDHCHIVIGCSEVSYLGHKFSCKGTSPDPLKVSANKEWPTLTNVTESTLLSTPILQSPDISKEFTVYTDASDIGLGAMLHQENYIVKMEGKLARWVLAIQENDATIEYRKGNQHNNANPLSRRPAGAALELQ